MESLPNELLLRIFGLAASGEGGGPLLLDVLPVVCRRWRDLARDPSCWAGVDVVLESCHRCEDAGRCQRSDEDHRRILSAARVVLHAPRLRKIDIQTLYPSKDCLVETKFILSALRRSDATVEEFRLPDDTKSYFCHDRAEPDDLDSLLAFMTRSKDTLRVVQLSGFLVRAEVEQVVAQLTGLEDLSVDVDHWRWDREHNRWDSEIKYHGSLRGVFTSLARLEMKADSRVHEMSENNDVVRLLVDLIAGSTSTLRELHLTGDCSFGSFRLPQAARLEVERCVQLRKLKCDVLDVPVVAAMPRLRSLELYLSCMRQVVNEIMPSVTQSLIQDCSPLHCLEHLRISICYDYDKVMWMMGNLEKYVQALTPLVAGVTSLELDAERVPVSDFLRCLQQLEVLTLERSSSNTLYALRDALPNLRALTGSILYREPHGYDDGYRQSAEAAVAGFKQQRPDVKTEIKLEERMSYESEWESEAMQEHLHEQFFSSDSSEGYYDSD